MLPAHPAVQRRRPALNLRPRDADVGSVSFRPLASTLLAAAALAAPAAVAPSPADARPTPVRVGERAKAKPAADRCRAKSEQPRRARPVWRAGCA